MCIVGGYSKEDQKPLAVLLRSGDCILLCGTSRLRMHGVAKVYDCPYGERRKGSRTVTPLTPCSEECKALCSQGCDMQKVLDAGGDCEGGEGEEVYHADMMGTQCPLRTRYGHGESAASEAMSAVRGKRKSSSCTSPGSVMSNEGHEKGSEDIHDIRGVERASATNGHGESKVEATGGGVCCEFCGQPALSAAEVNRVKRYLQIARVNINSRQVYPNTSSSSSSSSSGSSSSSYNSSSGQLVGGGNAECGSDISATSQDSSVGA
jgi:hypothetical protein